MFNFRMKAVLTVLLSVFFAAAFSASPAIAAKTTAEYQILATTMGGLQGMQAPLTLELDARGAPAPGGTQQAQHAIPPGLKMGSELPLLRPERSTSPEGVSGEQQNWTMKVYWGCSKEVQKGQPIVISPQDMKSGKGQFAKLVTGKGVWKGEPPAGWGWGQWPNRQSSIPVPGGASLKGDHLVTGNYLPDIKFSVTQHDFLPPLNVKVDGGDLKASLPITWQPVRGAIGYFAYAMASNQAKKETIIWTSSSKPCMGLMMHEHSDQVKKWVKDGIVLGHDKTACNIPAGIFAESEGVVVMMSAWGDDYWMSYPPKPANAPKDWKPDWTVNALFIARWTGMPGMPDMEDLMRGNSAPEAGYDEDESASDQGGSTSGQSGRAKPSFSIPIPIPRIRF